jgi:hypothetical protein
MGAWGTTLDPTGKSGIRFLADPHGELTSALDLSFDGAAIFGNARSKRYALVVENGKVTQAHVEPDNTGLNGVFISPVPYEVSRSETFDILSLGNITDGELFKQLALPRRCLEVLKSNRLLRSVSTRLVNIEQKCKTRKYLNNVPSL